MGEQFCSGRSRNYDFLRVVCTVAVILIHVSSSYKNAYTDISAFGRLYTDNLLMTCIYNVVPRFAVPCFIMLSGAFILADDRNVEYRSFWHKKMQKTGIPALLFSCGYFLWNMFTVLYGGGYRGGYRGGNKTSFETIYIWGFLLSYVVYVYVGGIILSDAVSCSD